MFNCCSVFVHVSYCSITRRTSQRCDGVSLVFIPLMCYEYIYLQDTELLRRQALEKRLAQEEAKRAEKPKKKKKKLF